MSVVLREEHRLKVFENRLMSRICGPKFAEVMEEWRKLHAEKRCKLYCAPYIVRMIRSWRVKWARHASFT
jgi:hypothetical protein